MKPIAYLEAHSPPYADRVKAGILAKIDGLLKHPEQYNPDKYKRNNDGSFRALESYYYRISYRYKVNEIRIIRFWHTRMNPLHY